MDATREQLLRDVIDSNEYITYLGLEITELREGYAHGKFPYDKKLANPYGSIHGGVLYSVADIVSGFAACTYGNDSSTIDGSMNYIRPAMNTEYVHCDATVVRQGRQIAVYDVKITDDNGLVLDTGCFHFYIMPPKM